MMRSYELKPMTGTLAVSKEFMRKAQDPDGQEYKLLTKILRDFPDIKIVSKTNKTKSARKRNPYKSLTYKKMEEFILLLPESASIMSEFDTMKKLTNYIAVAEWFLNRFPNFHKDPISYIQSRAS